MSARLPIQHIARETVLVKEVDKLAHVKGGFFKDFVRKIMIARDEPWWNSNDSPWKLYAVHPWAPENAYTPDYWEERVMDLCSFDITKGNFGLSYLDLMDLDPATFEKIEERVHNIAQKQQTALAKEGIVQNMNGV